MSSAGFIIQAVKSFKANRALMKGRKKADLHELFHEKSREPLSYKKMTKKELEIFKEKLKINRKKTLLFQFSMGIVLISILYYGFHLLIL